MQSGGYSLLHIVDERVTETEIEHTGLQKNNHTWNCG